MRLFYASLASCRNSSFLVGTMNGKHLSKGSTNPPLQKGKLRLYSMRFCPYAQRAHLVLDAKKIPYDTVNVNLDEKPEWYFQLNPLGKVPAILLESGDCIYESLIIADYLDEKFLQTPLHSKDSLQKAKDKILIELFGQVSRNLFRFYHNIDKECFEVFLKSLDVCEKELHLRKKTYFGGERPGMVDYMIWPFVERFSVLHFVAGDEYILPKERFFALNEWEKAMMQDAAVKISYIEPEIHAKFISSFLSGTPDYDIMAQ